MFGLGKPKLPITNDERQWVDFSLRRLAVLLGPNRLLEAEVILPTPAYFPDRYDGTEDSLLHLFARVASAMQVDPESVQVTLFTSVDAVAQDLLPVGSVPREVGAGGLYFHTPEAKPHISIHESKLKDPMALVAVLAHELAHIILLRPGLVQRDEPDMEPLTDLLTVFLGLGIFNANAAFQFSQYTNPDTQGWSVKRLGYLPEEIFGYALARFAYERGELKPAWASHLSSNIAPYQKRSLRWLIENGAKRLFE